MISGIDEKEFTSASRVMIVVDPTTEVITDKKGAGFRGSSREGAVYFSRISLVAGSLLMATGFVSASVATVWIGLARREHPSETGASSALAQAIAREMGSFDVAA